MWGHQGFLGHQCWGWDGHPKINVWASAPISHPQSYELAISRTKRGRVEFIMASYILQASPVWWVPLMPECQCWLPHTPGPLHQTFHLSSNRDALENIQRTAHASCSSSLEESQLSVTGQVADTSHFEALSQPHSYLEFVPLGHWWHTLPTQLAQLYKEEWLL